MNAQRTQSAGRLLGRILSAAALLALVAGPFAPAPLAATALDKVRLSPDITVRLGAPLVEDESVASDDLDGTVVLVGIGSLPASTDLDGYHLMSNGHQLLSFDTTVALPGGLTARPGDVVRYDGVGYTMEFNAALQGLPRGVDTDAVSMIGNSLLLSFDVAVDLGAGLRVDDEDLVLFNGSSFSLYFDGSAAGIARGLDLDAAHYLDCNGRLFLSFDGSGSIGGVAFDDEDVLEYDGISTWQMAYDGSVRHATWRPGDLDALHVTADPGPGPAQVFGQTIFVHPNEVDVHWANPVSWKAVRGSFVLPGDIGNYIVDQSYSGTGTSFPDPSVPAPGTGYWYLVKPGGCLLTSWQTTLGAEPGRDAALP